MRFFARLLPMERAAFAAMGVLALALAGVVFAGDRAQPRLLAFSWADQRVGRGDDSFTLTFDQPMAWETVVAGLEIDPPLPGKISWAGRTLAYTLTDLPAYGTDYTLRLEAAEAPPRSPQQSARLLPPREMSFTTRDLTFAYLGLEGEAAGRLILRNETRDQTIELTPGDLVVTNFEPYASGDRILFSAYERHQGQGVAEQQLYTVSTGLGRGSRRERPGRIELLLAADEHQNLNFDLAAQGEIALVQRVNRRNREEASLWVLPPTGAPRSLGVQSNRFKLTPTGDAVAIAQEQGVALVPLLQSAGTWQFFPGYQAVLAFSRQDTRTKVMVRDNRDRTQSLYLLQGNGRATELMQTQGRFLDCAFEPRRETYLYCLHTEPPESEASGDSHFLSLVEVAGAESVPLIALTDDPNVRMSLSPDGRALLFDQVLRSEPASELADPEILGTIWSLKLPDLSGPRAYVNFQPPREVGAGVDPRWLP